MGMNSNHGFLLATLEAQKSTHYKTRIGAVILEDNNIILSSGFNQEKSHPLQKKLNVKYRGFSDDSCHHYLHAELSAILKTKASLPKATLYVARILRTGKLGMCRPCPACMAAIRSVGIQVVRYTTDQGYCEEVLE